MIGDDGSTATTATVRPGSPQLRDQRRDERRLAGARRPGDPDEVRAAGQRVEPAQRVLGDRRVVLDRGQQAGERPPVAGAGGVGEGRGAGRRGLGPSVARPATSRGVALARMKSATSRIVVPGPNTAATPAAASGSMSSSGMIPPTVTSTSSRPALVSCCATRGHERHVGARQDRQARRRPRPPGAPRSRSSRASGGGPCRRPRSPRRAGRARAPSRRGRGRRGRAWRSAP